jgi:hypothetical protein
MFGRKANYETKNNPTESVEKLTKRFSQELRTQIRRITNVSIFSKEWLTIADILEHVSKVAVMESKNSKKKEGSLWERDEFTVRFIIEEGKLNFLLRSLTTFKTLQYSIREGKVDLNQYSNALKMDIHMLNSKILKYEQSLGLLLECCFGCIEALQITDLHELWSLVSGVLEQALNPNFQPIQNEDFPTLQEVLVFHYVKSVASLMEQLDEESIIKSIIDKDILNLMCKVLEKIHPLLSTEEQNIACDALSGIMETERFQTYRDECFPTIDDKLRMVSLHGMYLLNF